MTPKEYATYILRDVSHKADITELAQAYLALDSRIQKLEAVAEAAVAIVEEMRLRPFSPDTWVISNLREALAKLEQP